MELHCRQKAQGVQPGPRPKRHVADPQQEFYSQVINKMDEQLAGQLVGDLWNAGGASLGHAFPALRGHAYAGKFLGQKLAEFDDIPGVD